MIVVDDLRTVWIERHYDKVRRKLEGLQKRPRGSRKYPADIKPKVAKFVEQIIKLNGAVKILAVAKLRKRSVEEVRAAVSNAKTAAESADYNFGSLADYYGKGNVPMGYIRIIKNECNTARFPERGRRGRFGKPPTPGGADISFVVSKYDAFIKKFFRHG
jgi:hypothetical protein